VWNLENPKNKNIIKEECLLYLNNLNLNKKIAASCDVSLAIF